MSLVLATANNWPKSQCLQIHGACKSTGHVHFAWLVQLHLSPVASLQRRRIMPVGAETHQ